MSNVDFESSASYGHLLTRMPFKYNLKRDFGATGDGTTDDTAAINAALSAMKTAGGGVCLVPDGIYCFTQIIYPNVANINSGMMSLGFVSLSGNCSHTFGTVAVGSPVVSNKGAIFKCTATGSTGGIIAAGGGDFQGFNCINAKLKGIQVRTPQNPQYSAVDFSNAAQCDVEDSDINTGVYAVLAIQPTYTASAGLITPRRGNGAYTSLRNVSVSGFYKGFIYNEHSTGNNLIATSCLIGHEFATADHPSHLGRLEAQRCQIPVKVAGAHLFEIAQLAVEHVGSGQYDSTNSWQQTTHDLVDDSNLGLGRITWSTVLGNVGQVNTFTKSGGTNIECVRVGTPLYQTGTTGGSGSGSTPIIYDIFSGTDGASIVGRTPDTNHTSANWIVPYGTAVIQRNRLSHTTGGATASLIDTGKTDATISTKIHSLTTAASLVLRYVDSDNLVVCSYFNGNIQLTVIASGTVTDVAVTAVSTPVAEDELKVIITGQQYKVYWKDVLLSTTESVSSFQTNTMRGLRSYDPAIYSEFKVI